MADCQQRGKCSDVNVAIITECQPSSPKLSNFHVHVGWQEDRNLQNANKVNPKPSCGGRDKLQRQEKTFGGGRNVWYLESGDDFTDVNIVKIHQTCIFQVKAVYINLPQ